MMFTQIDIYDTISIGSFTWHQSPCILYLIEYIEDILWQCIDVIGIIVIEISINSKYQRDINQWWEKFIKY